MGLKTSARLDDVSVAKVALAESLAVSVGVVGACPASSVRIVSVATEQ